MLVAAVAMHRRWFDLWDILEDVTVWLGLTWVLAMLVAMVRLNGLARRTLSYAR